MKNIFRIFAAMVAGVVLFASCLNEAAPLASSVSVDKTAVSAEGAGAAPITVKVTADGDWFALTSAEWISVEPANGGQGVTEVSIKVADNVDKYNELNGPRSGSVSFCYGTAGVATTEISQKGENGLDASRTYSKVASVEEIVEGSYLIVFNYDGKYQALNAFNADSESRYSYLYADEVTPVDGVITRPNASNGYNFVAAEGGFKIAMPNGRYLFQAATYNNFYSTTDIAKADVWTVTLDENGLATIKNITVADKYMQYTSYGNAGAYSAEQSGAVLPSLYKDAKPATDEILIVPEKVTVLNTATSATINVSSNKKWSVRNHDSWIKTFTKSGEGNGAIEITFDAYASDTEDRTAEFLVIGETTNYTVVLTQMKSPTTIAEIYPQITGTSSSDQSSFSVSLKNPAVVTYVNGNNAFIEDATGGILYYKSGHGLSVGQKISGSLEGKGYIYNGVAQIASITSEPTIEAGEAPEYPVVTLAEILDNYSRYLSCVVKISGVKVDEAFSNSDRDGKISQNSKNLNVRVQNTKTAFTVTKDSEGDIICVPSLYNTTKQLGFWDPAHFTATKIVSAITMPETLSIYVEDVKALGATTNSTETITYVSSDPTVATVDADGNVTALKVGEATITASVAAEGICTAAEATCVVTVSEKPASEQTWSHTFEKGGLKIGGNTLNGKNWTFAMTDSDYLGWDNNASAKGIQMGSGSKPAKKVVLSTSEITGTIKSIKVNTSGANGTDGKLNIKVGSAAFGSEVVLTTSATDYTFAGSASGTIELIWTCSQKAMYVKSIEVVYE